MTYTILIADDDPLQRQMISSLLKKKLGYEVIAAAHGQEVMEHLDASNVGDIDAVLLDIEMPLMDGFETLRAIRKLRPDLPVLMLTGTDDTVVAVKAIKEGAQDFIVKPPNPAHIEIALHNAIRLSALTREVSRLKRDKEGALAFTDLVGHQGGLADAVAMGRKAATADVPILIMGDTGVGKELLARAIHGESRRVGAPFIALNCGAIPENLVESVLFGHEKGAFTGAINRTIGKFREAEGGTIFLDEIGELPLDAQVKLLRVLQQREVEPVGAGRPVKVDMRIISATHRDLRREVEAGRFREDLYFRLNILPITLPPLRARPQDIHPLADYFMQRLAAADGLPGKTLSQDARDYLTGYAWPGNVRELENLIHRALVLSEGDTITREALAGIHEHGAGTPTSVLPLPPAASSALALAMHMPEGRFKTMEEIETEAMQSALAHFDNNVSRAAAALGIAKSTFYRKIKDAS